MAPELLPHLHGVQIEELDCSVTGPGEDEVSSVMELQLPDGTSVNVLESVSNRRVDEVPHFDGLVTTSSDQVRASGVEVDGGDPVLVTLSSHYILVVVQVPDLPGAIITGRGNDLFLRVQAHSSNGSGVSIDLLLTGGSLVEHVISL